MAFNIHFSSIARSIHRAPPSITAIQMQLRHKHQVRVIVTRDLPEGHMRGIYAGEVHNVAAGYARNYLIPQKMAVYATPRNFDRCGLIDPEIAAKEEAKQQKNLVSAYTDGDEGNEDLKAADVLRRYLRNKTVKIIRHVDPNQPLMCHPGHVSAKNLRDKLSKQLKIDLEKHETIRIRNEPVAALEDKGEEELMQLIMEIDEVNLTGKNDADNGEATKDNDGSIVPTSQNEFQDCDTKLKQLGDYVAKITLAGGHMIPLKFNIGRR